MITYIKTKLKTYEPCQIKFRLYLKAFMDVVTKGFEATLVTLKKKYIL